MASVTDLSDDQAVQRVIDGDVTLFEVIVRRYNAYLYKVGRSYNYSHEDTQDLMQDTFVDAYKNLRQFEQRANFKTWLTRIMLNNCYRKRLKFSVTREVNQEIQEEAVPMFAYTKTEADTIAHNNELGTIIEKALAAIPEDYRMVFSLREVSGLSVSETADLLHITDVNVKVRLNRAKSMLRQHIERSYSAQELFEFHAVYCDAMVDRVMHALNHVQMAREV